jgi:hypothetical protein
MPTLIKLNGDDLRHNPLAVRNALPTCSPAGARACSMSHLGEDDSFEQADASPARGAQVPRHN